jgi:hypothetical protein
MALSPRSQALLEKLMERNLLEQPNIKLRKMPTVPNRTQPADFASYLLTHTSAPKGMAKAFSKSLASREGAESEEQSMLGKFFDTVMSIGNYPAAGIADAIGEGMDEDESFMENAWDSISGAGSAVLGNATRFAHDTVLKPATWIPGIGDDIDEQLTEFEDRLAPRRTFKDVLQKHAGIDGALGAGLGLGLDIALDPTTYLGIGVGKNIARGAKSATDILDAKAADPSGLRNLGALRSKETNKPLAVPNLPKAPVAEEAISGGIGAFPFQQLPKLPHADLPPLPSFQPRTRRLKRHLANDTDELGLTPGQARAANAQPPVRMDRFRDVAQKWERANQDWQRAMMKRGKVAESPKRFSTYTANNVVTKILAGETPSTLPKVVPATGEVAKAARNVADDYIDNLMNQKFNVKTMRWQGPDGKMVSRKLPPEAGPSKQIALMTKLTQVTGDVTELLPALRAAEDHLIRLGVQPVGPNGLRVRLSDVIAATQEHVPIRDVLNSFAMKDFSKMDPVVRSAIHGLAAQRTVNMSDIVANLSKLATEAQANITDNLMGAARAKAESELIDASVEHGLRMGMTNAETKAIKDLIKDIVNIDKLPTENWIMHAGKELTAAVNAGKVDAKLLDRFNKMVEQTQGVTGKSLVEKISGHNVLDSIMTRMTTWWGKADLQRYAHNMFVWGERNAESRAAALRYYAKNFTKDERRAAWKVAAGGIDDADPRVMELANFYNKYFEHVLRLPKHGLSLVNAQNKHLSVAERSMMMMDDVNRHLKDMGNKFQFSKKAIEHDAWQQKRNFSQHGEGWLSSWSRWDPDDPVNFIYDIDLALERTTKEYAFLDDFVSKFGSLTKDAEHTFQVKTAPRIADFYVPEEMGRQMMRVLQTVHKGQYKPNTKFGRFYQRALSIWKTGVTIYLPSHHVRNAIGDIHLMWWAGHNNPFDFILAKRVMHSQRTRYKNAIKTGDLDELAKVTDPNAASWAATNGTDVIFRVGDTAVTADELFVAAHQRGLLLDANRLEDIFGESRIGFSPFGGKVHAVPVAAAEYREHFIRMAHFIAASKKGLKRGNKNLADVFDQAAFEVRKWHPDGRDLTHFEQKWMRSIIPFYSWFRKSTPLLFETMLTRPAKLMAYPKGMVGLQQMLGIDATMYDPFPDDQLFPDWLRESGIGPIGDPESDNPFARWWGNLGRNAVGVDGSLFGYSFVNPGTPFTDFGSQMLGYGPQDTVQGLYEMTTPFLKVPTDLARDDQFPGKPIYERSGGDGVLPYLSTVLPQTAPASRVFDFGKDKDRPNVEPQSWDKEALINMLTAARLYNSGQYIKGAEFEAKERAKRAREQ